MRVDYDSVSAAVRARLSPQAYAHCERVAQTAERIAAAYGVDTESARLAGLLHDWDREVPLEDLLARARDAGIPVTEVDEALPYLLHGPVAASELPSIFPGLDDDVLEAIAAHTYGGEELTPLAMVVYVADVVEPGRTHGEVEHLRRLVGRVPLHELFADAYAASVAHLVRRRRPIHPKTVSVWNKFVARGAR